MSGLEGNCINTDVTGTGGPTNNGNEQNTNSSAQLTEVVTKGTGRASQLAAMMFLMECFPKARMPIYRWGIINQ